MQELPKKVATAKFLLRMGELVDEIIRQRQQEIKDSAPPEPVACPTCGKPLADKKLPKRKKKGDQT